MTAPKLYTVPRVARIFGVNPATVRRWVYAGSCPAQQVGDGGHWRIPAAWVEAEMAKIAPRIERARRRIVEVE